MTGKTAASKYDVGAVVSRCLCYLPAARLTPPARSRFFFARTETGGEIQEICAQGFRNPFKCSFDRGTNDGTGRDDLWCGDVGNYEVESIKKVE